MGYDDIRLTARELLNIETVSGCGTCVHVYTVIRGVCDCLFKVQYSEYAVNTVTVQEVAYCLNQQEIYGVTSRKLTDLYLFTSRLESVFILTPRDNFSFKFKLCS